MSEENKQETTTDVQSAAPASPEVVIVPETNDDIFITENDTFDCSFKYYKDGINVVVSGVDDDFDATKPSKTITFTCKYPSQADYQSIINSNAFKGITDELTGTDLIKLEMTRLSLLLRKWSVSKPLDKLLDADPKIIKGMLVCVSKVIGLKGLF